MNEQRHTRRFAHWRLPALLLMAAVWLAIAGAPAAARTIELEAKYIDQAAMISAHAPRASWAGKYRWSNSMLTTTAYVTPAASLLIRYDLSEIPEDMRVTKAELFIPVRYHAPDESRMSLWRMLVDWGPGVCHEDRTVDPEPTPWHKAGGTGAGEDRTLQPSQFIYVEEGSETYVVNVTQDVALWHRGSAPNHGWMLSIDDRGTWVHMNSPLGAGGQAWMLRITYEPR